MRIKHIENATAGLAQACRIHKYADDLPNLAERIRWLTWHGQTERAIIAIHELTFASNQMEGISRSEIDASIKRISNRCAALEAYLGNNSCSILNYNARYNLGYPISSSRAEGCVDDIANTRMGKRRRMRWSLRGAHRVAITRPAVLDGRLTISHSNSAA